MAVAANQRLMAQTNFWRSILSARAPAGSVKRKKASDATVDMSDMKSGDSLSIFIDQVAALSWAATQVPEITVASQSFLKTGFLRAVQVEPLVIIKSPSRYKRIWFSEFQDFCEVLLSASRGCRRPNPEKAEVRNQKSGELRSPKRSSTDLFFQTG